MKIRIGDRFWLDFDTNAVGVRVGDREYWAQSRMSVGLPWKFGRDDAFWDGPIEIFCLGPVEFLRFYTLDRDE